MKTFPKVCQENLVGSIEFIYPTIPDEGYHKIDYATKVRKNRGSIWRQYASGKTQLFNFDPESPKLTWLGYQKDTIACALETELSGTHSEKKVLEQGSNKPPQSIKKRSNTLPLERNKRMTARHSIHLKIIGYCKIFFMEWKCDRGTGDPASRSQCASRITQPLI